MASNNDCTTQKTISITTNEFLEFLKLTCQVNDSMSGSEGAFGMDEIDYNKLGSNPLINLLITTKKKDSEMNFQNIIGDGILADKKTEKIGKKKTSNSTELKLKKSKGDATENQTKMHPSLTDKLDEIINEGILDSVLPFICPPPIHTTASTGNNLSVKQSKNFKTRESSPIANSKVQSGRELENKENGACFKSACTIESSTKIKESKSIHRNSTSQIQSHLEDRKLETTEVIIHVCDEVKNTSKDFVCPQHLLVNKMGYFADVTAGQKLEDMDISVHCDLQIFDWLMKWVKKDATPPDSWPTLDANNVVPILVSASFLQMEPLLLDCLSFCHSRLNEIVRASTNLSCLNDTIITRLAAMFTNLELEMVKDKKERITPRLWTKMLQSLCEPEPQALRGHYFSLGGLFRCNRCGKLLTQAVSSYISCIPGNMKLNRWGQLISQHYRDASWQITTYVALLFKELKSWRKVYWKLWGHCHFLYCCLCESHFPTYQMNWCHFHTENPQFLGPVSEGKMAGPAGRYACCGQQAFRFETLPGPNGCQYREHSVLIETDRDRAILTLAQIAAEGNCLYEDAPAKPQIQGNQEPRWAGITLMPTKCRQGLLPPMHLEEYNGRISRRMRQISCLIESSSDTDTSELTDQKYIRKHISSSSDGCESEPSTPRRYRNKVHRRRARGSAGRYWSGEMSARSNQDNQREFEEKIMKQVIAMVSKKTGTDTTLHYSNQHAGGGSYVRLEAEWKEQLKQKLLNKPKMK